MKINRFRVGQITSATGLKGEVKVYPYTDYKERFEELEWIYLENQTVRIEKVRYQNQLVILKLAGISDRTAAESNKGKYLYIDRTNARSLPEDTYFIADLIGLVVVLEDGTRIGQVKDVIQNAAQDLYEIECTSSDGQAERCLIPAVDEFIKKIDMTEQTITVRLIDGLLNEKFAQEEI